MLFLQPFVRSLKIRKYLFTFSQGRKIATIKWSRTQTSFGIFWRRFFIYSLPGKLFIAPRNNNGIVSTAAESGGRPGMKGNASPGADNALIEKTSLLAEKVCPKSLSSQQAISWFIICTEMRKKNSNPRKLRWPRLNSGERTFSLTIYTCMQE